MLTLLENINKHFENKFSFLKLYEVVYDKGLNVCSITFLYPFNHEELTNEERDQLTNYIREFLSLNAKVRLKLKKSFLDDNLIIKEIQNYFEAEHKALLPYIFQENIKINSNEFDIKVNIGLNQDIFSILDETQIIINLTNFLTKRFIASFEVTLYENQERLPEELDFEDIPMPISPRTPRYKVQILNSLFGGDISPNPEYINDNKKPKDSVILAGIITDLTKKNYIAKNGKRKGQEKCLYKFNLTDEKSIECVHFSTKTSQPVMDKMEDGMYVLCLGHIQTGLGGGISYTIKRMALAQKCALEIKEVQPLTNINHKRVVFPEKIISSSQGNLFEEGPKYNDYIMSNTFVVYDLETTGLDTESCEIIEIGAVKVEEGKIKEKFSTFVKPKGKIQAEATAVNGITNQMVAHAPDVQNAILDFYEYTRGCILSGYNIVGYDMKVLKNVAAKFGIKFDNEIMDVIILARQSNLRTPNYKLGSVVSALGLTLKDAHRAYNDAFATAEVLLELSKLKK